MNLAQEIGEWKQNLHSRALPASGAATGLQTAARSAAMNRAAPADSSGSSGSNSGSDSTVITANDFLQLLVAEMQNQDPTADTDPNQYIDQLVQVNSLEQLIQINQDLGGNSGASGSSSSGSLAHGHSRDLGTAANTPAAGVATALAPHAGPQRPFPASSFSGAEPGSPVPVPSDPSFAARVRAALAR